ncbi:response regulator [Lysobacter korlensis]|uniref:Response regulator n=1 Tax=Lysobacter korlensis TaxID=553636 RepID=A0ABV6RPU0_9GAMM
MLESEPVDVLVPDVGMSEMDGYELIRRVRGIARFANLPAIAATGFARDDDARAAMEAGFSAHIGKPVLIEQLAEVIDEVMRVQHESS